MVFASRGTVKHGKVVAAALACILVAPLSGCSGGDGSPAGLPGDDAQAPPPGADAASDHAASDAVASPDAAPQGCGEFAGDTRYTCSKDGNARGECVSGSLNEQACSRGCLRETAPTDDVCMGTSTSWSCTGTYGTTKAQNGDYYITSFGCWVDANSTVHTDPGDNCIPGCFTKAKSSGLCGANDTGPQCEEKVDWYVADSGRFGCLARLRVENPNNGKKAIVVVLDAGPACWTEQNVSHAILDASGRLNEYLFGTQNGYSDKALVHVVEVDEPTPLGPI